MNMTQGGVYNQLQDELQSASKCNQWAYEEGRRQRNMSSDDKTAAASIRARDSLFDASLPVDAQPFHRVAHRNMNLPQPTTTHPPPTHLQECIKEMADHEVARHEYRRQEKEAERGTSTAQPTFHGVDARTNSITTERIQTTHEMF